VTGSASNSSFAGFRPSSLDSGIIAEGGLAGEVNGDADTPIAVTTILQPGQYRLAAWASVIFAGTAAYDFTMQSTEVPEPSIRLLALTALAMVAGLRRALPA
jgi:hypothetical protein